MKNLRIIAILICFGFVGLQGVYAQSNKEKEQVVYKVQMLEVPDSVKETLKNYSGYEISKDVSYQLKETDGKARSKAEKIYRFKIEQKNYPYVLLVNEKGKVMGIDAGEGN